MRFILGRGWVFCDETNGEGDGNGDAGGAAGSSGDAAGGADDDAGTDAGADDDGAAAGKGDDKGADKGAAAGDQPKDMLEAITKGLEKTAPKVDDEDGEAKKAEAAAAAAKAGKHANGAPKKNEKGEDLDDAGKLIPKQEPKAKTAAELELKPEEKKALGAKAQARFSEVITTLKARESEIAALNDKMKPLAEARDSIMGVLKETNTSSEQLGALLEFNRLVQSGAPKDLETALSMIEEQRAALYTALGREPEEGGIDLLAEFPDLKQKVTEATMTRADALELAAARRTQAAAEAREKAQNNHQQTQQQAKAAQDKAQQDIEIWCNGLAKSDIDYKGKEEKLLEQVDEVIKTYPPNQWLSTLKLIYKGIVVHKASAPNKGTQPLRPTGAKPGDRAPQTMHEAMWGVPKGT